MYYYILVFTTVTIINHQYILINIYIFFTCGVDNEKMKIIKSFITQSCIALSVTDVCNIPFLTRDLTEAFFFISLILR